jgi:hypothetical protein
MNPGHGQPFVRQFHALRGCVPDIGSGWVRGKVFEHRRDGGRLDAKARENDLAAALDFNHPKLAAPPFDVPPGPFGALCPIGATTPDEEWAALRDLAQSYGWPVG